MKTKQKPFFLARQKPFFLARFTGKGGYDGERRLAKQVFKRGYLYRVIGGSMGQSHTSFVVEGIHGYWNSALFESNETEWGSVIENPYRKNERLRDLMQQECLRRANLQKQHAHQQRIMDATKRQRQQALFDALQKIAHRLNALDHSPHRRST